MHPCSTAKIGCRKGFCYGHKQTAYGVQAQLTHVDGKRAEQMDVRTETEADALSRRISTASFQVRFPSRHPPLWAVSLLLLRSPITTDDSSFSVLPFSAGGVWKALSRATTSKRSQHNSTGQQQPEQAHEQALQTTCHLTAMK